MAAQQYSTDAEGNRIIGASRRPDGSIRKEIKACPASVKVPSCKARQVCLPVPQMGPAPRAMLERPSLFGTGEARVCTSGRARKIHIHGRTR